MTRRTTANLAALATALYGLALYFEEALPGPLPWPVHAAGLVATVYVAWRLRSEAP